MPRSRPLAPEPRHDSPRGRPTSQRAGELRARIVEVASELMLVHGFDGTSLDAIAAHAGVTKRTIYTRFDSKEALLRDVLAHAAIPAFQGLSAPPPEMAQRDALVAIATALHAALMDPQMQRWLPFAVHGLARRPELNALMNTVIEEYLAFIEHLLRSVLADDPLRGTPLASVTKAFVSLVSAPAQNLAFLSVDPGSPEEQRQYIGYAVDVFMRGCLAAQE